MRLIDADALIKAFEDCTGDCACCVHNTNDFDYCGLIDDAPTVTQFVSSPTEVIKIGEPLSNSDEISTAFEKGEIYRRGFEDARKRYERLPGEWIDHGYSFYICNNCGMGNNNAGGCKTNFCPNCGADMRGNNNDTV